MVKYANPFPKFLLFLELTDRNLREYRVIDGHHHKYDFGDIMFPFCNITLDDASSQSVDTQFGINFVSTEMNEYLDIPETFFFLLYLKYELTLVFSAERLHNSKTLLMNEITIRDAFLHFYELSNGNADVQSKH